MATIHILSVIYAVKWASRHSGVVRMQQINGS